MLQKELIEAALFSGRAESAVGVALMALRDVDAAKDAREIGVVCEQAWSEFHIAPVVRLIELLKQQGVDEALLKQVRDPLRDHFKQASQWSKTLAAMRLERLARELRWAVRQHTWPQAVELAAAIIDAGEGDKNLRYVGSVIGSVDNDVAAGRETMKRLGQARPSLIPEGMALIDEGFRSRLEDLAKGGGGEFREREFIASLTQATVDLKNKLPTRLDKDRAETMVAAFAAEVRGILAVGFRFPEINYWPDIVRLLVEFLPREMTETGKAAGVEARQYQSLAPEARRGCSSVFREIGQKPPVVEQFLKLAREAGDDGDDRMLGMLVELLGGMRAEASTDFVVELARSTREPRLKNIALAALGNIGTPEALEVLVGQLRELMDTRVFDARRRTAIRQALQSLGRITRNPKTPEALRERLFGVVRQMLPESERDLCAEACMELLAVGMVPKADAATRRWATTCLTEHLWTPVQAIAGQASPDGKPTVLGARQRAADLLQVLAATEMPTILAIAQPKAMRFSGALVALGEILAKVRDSAALPLLEAMIQAASIVRAETIGQYEQETSFDVETEKYVQLTPGRVLDSLIYAVKETAEAELQQQGEAAGNGPAADLVRRLFERAKEGELAGLTSQASSMLFDLHQKLPASKNRRSPDGGGAAAGGASLADDAGTGAASGKGADDAESAPSAVALTSAEKAQLLSDLKKGGFFAASRRQRKIAAMLRLTQGGVLDAVPVLIEHLSDKDAMVAAAAGTALLDFTRSPQSAKVTEFSLHEMFTALEKSGRDQQKMLRGVLKQVNYQRPVVRDAMKRLAEAAPSPGFFYEVSVVMGLPGPDQARELLLHGKVGQPQAAAAAAPAEGAPSAEAGGAPAALPPATSALSALDRKRAALEARRAWIAGGKKGPPPPE